MGARNVAVALVVLLLASGLNGCGGGSGNENALAISFLLTLEDFPEGWKIRAQEDVEDGSSAPELACPEFPGNGLQGRAMTPDFTDEYGLILVNQVVGIFDSNEQASTAVDWVGERLGCTVDALNAGSIDTPEVKFSSARTEDVDFEQIGDVAVHLRVIFSAEPQGDPNYTGSLPMIQDYVTVAQGRYWFLIEATSVVFPTDLAEPELLASLAQKTVDRMTGAVPVASVEAPADATAVTCDESPDIIDALTALRVNPAGGDPGRTAQAVPEGLALCVAPALVPRGMPLAPAIATLD